jgi:hypothetical protein
VHYEGTVRRSLLGGLELAPAWSYAMSATIPYVKMDVTASVRGGPVGVRRSDSESGLGDIVLMPLRVNYIVDPDLSMNSASLGRRRGLAWEQKLGTNPFKLGFVGGTDDHNGMTAEVDEQGSYGAREHPRGAVGRDEGARNLCHQRHADQGAPVRGRRPAGQAAGPVGPVRQSYASGVPMGGTLAGLRKAPTFSVHTMKDPQGAHLDRIQIIKGWVDAKGGHQEKIVDVAWSGDRKPGANGKLSAVGNTVDLKTARYENSIGAAELMGGWTDKDFDPKVHALYYARVLEIPTPRWTTYEAVFNKLPLLTQVPATIQERAWTSPIWTRP